MVSQDRLVLSAPRSTSTAVFAALSLLVAGGLFINGITSQHIVWRGGAVTPGWVAALVIVPAILVLARFWVFAAWSTFGSEVVIVGSWEVALRQELLGRTLDECTVRLGEVKRIETDRSSRSPNALRNIRPLMALSAGFAEGPLVIRLTDKSVAFGQGISSEHELKEAADWLVSRLPSASDA